MTAFIFFVLYEKDSIRIKLVCADTEKQKSHHTDGSFAAG